MRRGRKPKPTISIETIEACLKLLEDGEKDNAIYHLTNLLVVKQFLNSPSLPSAEDIEGWGVRQFLVDLITTDYNVMRSLFDLHPVSVHETRAEALQSIKDVFKRKVDKYIEVCLFYYRYVRVDLGISNPEISELIPVSTRQLRRHRERGVRHLRDELIFNEWEARKQQHKTLLQKNIPQHPVELIERSTNLVINKLKNKPFIPFLITGGKGVGKTAYASSIASNLIADENEEYNIDYVLWLGNLNHPQQLESKLHDLVYRRNAQTKWQDIVAIRNLLLIIDNITIQVDDEASWKELFTNLSNTRVLICNDTVLPLSIKTHQIRLSDLSVDGAHQFVSQLDIANVLKTHEVEEIINQVGTNPHILHTATQGYLSNQLLSIKKPLLSHYEPIYSAVNTNDKLLWLVCSVTLNDGVNIQIQQHLTDYPDGLLLKNNVINYTYDRVHTSISASHYIISQYQNDAGLRERFHQFLMYLSEKSHDTLLIDACLCDWLNLPVREIYDIIISVDLTALSSEYLKKWLQIADIKLSNVKSYQLLYAYGTALRCLNQYDIAVNVLQTAIINSSKVGDFHTQAQARYELALIAQAQGQLDRALNIYQHITRLSISAHLKNNIYLQMARIMIERGDGRGALDYLEGLESLNALILKCEAYFLLKEYRRAHNIVSHHLHDDQIKSDLMISMHTILGRIAQSTNMTEDAINHFNEALIIADNHGNWIDIARARSNFASGHLSSGRKLSIELIVELEELLHESEEIQKRTRDVIGLEATRRNLKQIKKLYLQTP